MMCEYNNVDDDDDLSASSEQNRRIQRLLIAHASNERARHSTFDVEIGFLANEIKMKFRCN